MATHYVSPTGSATWEQSTSIDAPCSLTTANGSAAAGDLVYLRAGTYTTTIEPTNSGSEGSYITFKAYTDETATIDKSGGGNGATLNAKSYICIDGLSINGDATYTHTGKWFELTNQANYNIIQNCTCTHALTWGGLDLNNCDHNQILNNHFEDGGGDVIEIFPGSYNVLAGNTVIGGDIQTGDYAHSCLCIRGNETTWSEYNEVRDNEFYDSADDVAGILLETRYNTFERNIFHDPRSTAGSCFKFCGGTENIFRHNICYGAGVGFIIYTNVWGGRSVPAIGHKVYNNVFYGNTTGGTGDYVGGISLTAYEGADVIQYNEIKNNIIVGNSPRQIQIIAAEAEQSKILDNEIDHNIIYGTAAGQNTVKRWTTLYTTAGADAGLSEFSGNIDADPAFENAGGSFALASDFKIKADSPAKDAGVLLNLTADYFGGSIPSGSAPDIGIHEYGQNAKVLLKHNRRV